MKRLILLGMLGVFGWMPYQAKAQLSINVNIGSQPLWGPVGYDYVDYYYMPDIECYYHVPKRQFIYMEGSRWRFSSSLPSRYRGYNLYDGYKVVVNSYRNYDYDRTYYSRYRNVRNQPVIRYSNDSRYYVVKGHPHYGSGRDRWDNDRGHGKRDNDRWDNDHGHGKRDDDRGSGKWSKGRDHRDFDHGRDRGNRGRGRDRG